MEEAHQGGLCDRSVKNGEDGSNSPFFDGRCMRLNLKVYLNKCVYVAVHEMRRYKELEPRQAYFKETLDSFMEEMKDFYKGLKEYKTNSTEEEKKKLNGLV